MNLKQQRLGQAPDLLETLRRFASLPERKARRCSEGGSHQCGSGYSQPMPPDKLSGAVRPGRNLG